MQADDTRHKIPTEAELKDFYPQTLPTVLYHYTNKAGYEGIMASKVIRASTIQGNKHTHFGKGIYFTTLGPDAIKGYTGYFKVIELVFNKITNETIDKMSYYFEVKVDPGWYPVVALDPSTKNRNVVDYIWIVQDDKDISVPENRIISHGMTEIGENADDIRKAMHLA